MPHQPRNGVYVIDFHRREERERVTAHSVRIALGQRDRVLDLFSCLTDPRRHAELEDSHWDDMWSRQRRQRIIRQLTENPLELCSHTSFIDGNDDVSDCELLVTEAELDPELVRAKLPRLKHVVQFGRFSPGVATNLPPGTRVVEFERHTVRSVAEHALAMTLALLRDLCRIDQRLKTNAIQVQPGRYAYNWIDSQPTTLADCRVCIVGFGQVGQAVWRLLSGFRPAALTYWSRRCNELVPQSHRTSLIDALNDADVAIVTLPLTVATKGLIGRDALEALGQRGILVNVARGAIVDQDELERRLHANLLHAAGLDVFAQEPIGADSALLDLDNVLLSPHSAGGSVDRIVLELNDLLEVCARAVTETS